MPACRATGALKRAYPETYRDMQQYEDALLLEAYTDIRAHVKRMTGSPAGSLDDLNLLQSGRPATHGAAQAEVSVLQSV